MKKMRSNKFIYYPLLFALLLMISCASTAPLPATLNIILPEPDISPEVAAFSGVWKGMWNAGLDTILVVEKINNETADIIFSLGEAGGDFIRPQNEYRYHTAKVYDNNTIEWKEPNGSVFKFVMDKNLKEIRGYFEDKTTGAKLWVYLYHSK